MKARTFRFSLPACMRKLHQEVNGLYRSVEMACIIAKELDKKNTYTSAINDVLDSLDANNANCTSAIFFIDTRTEKYQIYSLAGAVQDFGLIYSKKNMENRSEENREWLLNEAIRRYYESLEKLNFLHSR